MRAMIKSNLILMRCFVDKSSGPDSLYLRINIPKQTGWLNIINNGSVLFMALSPLDHQPPTAELPESSQWRLRLAQWLDEALHAVVHCEHNYPLYITNGAALIIYWTTHARIMRGKSRLMCSSWNKNRYIGWSGKDPLFKKIKCRSQCIQWDICLSYSF
jgi:hypothetical protein